MNPGYTLSALVIGAVVSQSVFGQASAPTRAEVKAQIETGSLAPSGDSSPNPKAETKEKSSKTRAERKNETTTAREAGALKPTGDAANAKEERDDLAKAAGVNRENRKADTRAAVKTRTTQPAGEATQPSAESPKK